MIRPPLKRGGWRLVPYIKATGRCQVLDFLVALRARALTKYVTFQEVVKPLLEERGPFQVGPPYWENLGDGWHDIRWSGRCRIYCSVEDPELVVMYTGCEKRWRTFDDGDRQACESGQADFTSNDYDQEQREYLYHARRNRESDEHS